MIHTCAADSIVLPADLMTLAAHFTTASPLRFIYLCVDVRSVSHMKLQGGSLNRCKAVNNIIVLDASMIRFHIK